jgi:L-2-hydroxyglutarate oxidase LhgO
MSQDQAKIDVLVVGAGIAGLAPASVAADAKAGGVFHAGYGAGLGMSLVLGRRAARTAMAKIRARRDAAPFSR